MQLQLLQLTLLILLLNCVRLLQAKPSLEGVFSASARSVELGEYSEDRVIHKAFLTWEVDFDRGYVVFELMIQTRGWIGLGFSPYGKMVDSDLVVGGVFPNGHTFIHDAHVGNEIKYLPYEDVVNNIQAFNITEKNGTTTMKFGRFLDTKDEIADYVIEDKVMYLIWAAGYLDNDEVAYHYDNKGRFVVNLLAKTNGLVSFDGGASVQPFLYTYPFRVPFFLAIFAFLTFLSL